MNPNQSQPKPSLFTPPTGNPCKRKPILSATAKKARVVPRNITNPRSKSSPCKKIMTTNPSKTKPHLFASPVGNPCKRKPILSAAAKNIANSPLKTSACKINPHQRTNQDSFCTQAMKLSNHSDQRPIFNAGRRQGSLFNHAMSSTEASAPCHQFHGNKHVEILPTTQMEVADHNVNHFDLPQQPPSFTPPSNHPHQTDPKHATHAESCDPEHQWNIQELSACNKRNTHCVKEPTERIETNSIIKLTAHDVQFMLNHPNYSKDDDNGHFVMNEDGGTCHHDWDDDALVQMTLVGLDELAPFETNQDVNPLKSNSIARKEMPQPNQTHKTPKLEICQKSPNPISTFKRFNKSPQNLPCSARLEFFSSDDSANDELNKSAQSSKGEKRQKSVSNEFVLTTRDSSDTENDVKCGKQPSTSSSSSSFHNHRHANNFKSPIAPNEISVVKRDSSLVTNEIHTLKPQIVSEVSIKKGHCKEDLDGAKMSRKIDRSTTLDVGHHAHK